MFVHQYDRKTLSLWMYFLNTLKHTQRQDFTKIFCHRKIVQDGKVVKIDRHEYNLVYRIQWQTWDFKLPGNTCQSKQDTGWNFSERHLTFRIIPGRWPFQKVMAVKSVGGMDTGELIRIYNMLLLPKTGHWISLLRIYA